MSMFMCAHAMGVPMEAPAGCWAPCSVSFSSSFRTGPATERGARLASSSDPPVSTLHKRGAKEGTATPSFLHGCCHLTQFLMLVQQAFLPTEPFLQLEKRGLFWFIIFKYI